MPKPSKQAQVQQYVQGQGWKRIGSAEWGQLRAALPNISVATVRNAIAALAVLLDQPFAGVSTTTLDQLEISLTQLAGIYGENPNLSQVCRAEVIAAKDRTRFAAQNPKTEPGRRVVKEEMVQWMLVWLGDPAMFGTWVALRKRLTTADPATLPESFPHLLSR